MKKGLSGQSTTDVVDSYIPVHDAQLGDYPALIPAPPRSKNAGKYFTVPLPPQSASVITSGEVNVGAIRTFDDIASHTKKQRRTRFNRRYIAAAPPAQNIEERFRERIELPVDMTDEDKNFVRSMRQDLFTRVLPKNLSVESVSGWNFSTKSAALPKSLSAPSAPFRKVKIKGEVHRMRESARKQMQKTAARGGSASSGFSPGTRRRYSAWFADDSQQASPSPFANRMTGGNDLEDSANFGKTLTKQRSVGFNDDDDTLGGTTNSLGGVKKGTTSAAGDAGKGDNPTSPTVQMVDVSSHFKVPSRRPSKPASARPPDAARRHSTIVTTMNTARVWAARERREQRIKDEDSKRTSVVAVRERRRSSAAVRSRSKSGFGAGMFAMMSAGKMMMSLRKPSTSNSERRQSTTLDTSEERLGDHLNGEGFLDSSIRRRPSTSRDPPRRDRSVSLFAGASGDDWSQRRASASFGASMESPMSPFAAGGGRKKSTAFARDVPAGASARLQLSFLANAEPEQDDSGKEDAADNAAAPFPNTTSVSPAFNPRTSVFGRLAALSSSRRRSYARKSVAQTSVVREDVETRVLNKKIDDWNAKRAEIIGAQSTAHPIHLETRSLTDDQFIRIEDDVMRATGRFDRLLHLHDFDNMIDLTNLPSNVQRLFTSATSAAGIIVAGNIITRDKFLLVAKSENTTITLYEFLQGLFYNVSAAKLEKLFVDNCFMLNRAFPMRMRYSEEIIQRMRTMFGQMEREPGCGRVPLRRLEELCERDMVLANFRLAVEHSLKGVIAVRRQSTVGLLQSPMRVNFGDDLAGSNKEESPMDLPYPCLRPDGLPAELNFEDFVFCMKFAFPPFRC